MMQKLIAALGVMLALALGSCARAVTTRKPIVARLPMPLTRTLIPAPVSITPGDGPAFALTPSTTIVVSTGDERAIGIGRWLSDLIGTAVAAMPPAIQPDSGSTPVGSIRLVLRAGAASGATGMAATLSDEAYELTVAPTGVTIAASHPAGLFYGVQTFRLLLPPFIEYSAVRPDTSRPVVVPAVHIVDRPRFEWRGAMLDVARHFFRVDEIKRYIDLLAMYKLNRLHLHLADDQGWRIEIASWPNLTTHGGSTEVGGGPGGYYSQQQYSELVAYAEARFITLVPEIDMPGHTNAALASYAELNCDDLARPLYTGIEVGFSALCVDKEVTYTFVSDVVRELSNLTPGSYFHIGGDEVKTLPPEQYRRFIDRVQTIVQSHGKRMIGWDEVSAASLRPSSIVQQWRPQTSPQEAVAKGARVIFSPAHKVYLDMKYAPETLLGLNWAGYVAVSASYDWDPSALFAGVPESAILGVEAPIWSETVANMHEVEYLAFPRLAAIAEIGWSRADRREWSEFSLRLGAQGPRWSALGLNFYRSPEVIWK